MQASSAAQSALVRHSTQRPGAAELVDEQTEVTPLHWALSRHQPLRSAWQAPIALLQYCVIGQSAVTVQEPPPTVSATWHAPEMQVSPALVSQSRSVWQLRLAEPIAMQVRSRQVAPVSQSLSLLQPPAATPLTHPERERSSKVTPPSAKEEVERNTRPPNRARRSRPASLGAPS